MSKKSKITLLSEYESPFISFIELDRRDVVTTSSGEIGSDESDDDQRGEWDPF